MFGFVGGEYHLSLGAAIFPFGNSNFVHNTVSLSVFPCVSRNVPISPLGFYGLNWKSKYLDSPV